MRKGHVQACGSDRPAGIGTAALKLTDNATDSLAMRVHNFSGFLIPFEAGHITPMMITFRSGWDERVPIYSAKRVSLVFQDESPNGVFGRVTFHEKGENAECKHQRRIEIS